MKQIESMLAAYEISTLMMSAKESVTLFAPDGWQFFSFENYPPILHDVAKLGVHARFIFGLQMFPAELEPARHLPLTGCHIRILAEPPVLRSYVIVDEFHAIQGKYVPGRQTPYVAFTMLQDAATITGLIKEFDNSWTRADRLQVLFPLIGTESSRLIDIPKTEVVAWSPKLSELAKNPEDLYKLEWREFEELIAELLARDGFEVTLTPKSRDGGRDVLAARTLPTGPILCLVECKRYAKHRHVNIEQVRALFGTVTDEGATSGLIVTTSSFSTPAQQFARNHSYRLALKEHADLVAWLRKVSAG